jgi:hypothetical protein
MTTPADVRTDEEAFAACLAGRPVPAGAQGLAAFTDAVRASATEPGRPNAALAELLATGLLVPTQEPSRGTAGRPARTSRKRPHVLISTLTAKFAAAGAVAKAACATGAVAVALTGTATTVALATPDEPTTVETSTTTQEPTTEGLTSDTQDPTSDTQDLTSETEPTDDLVGEPTGDQDATGSPEAENVVSPEGTATSGAPESQEVADTADVPPAPESPEASEGQGPTDGEKAERHPENHGGTVSAEAHRRNAERKAAREQAQPEPVAPVAEQAEEVLEAEQAPVVEQSAPAGHGKGNGKNGK